jgi:hypothetical protein
MRSNSSVAAILSIALIAVLAVCAGCDKKITPQEKSFIASVGLDANERAAAWDVAKANIVAADPANSTAVSHFIANQSDSLHALADGLTHLGEAITDGSNLSANARDALSQVADTSVARAADLRAMSKYITADPATLSFLAAHQKALDAEADSLTQLKALLAADASPAPKKAAVKVPSPVTK